MAQTPRPSADAGISIGQVFLGKYRVEAILGHGGMGVVAKCIHLGLNDPVAIKMLRQDVLRDRDATERFMREAQAASKLRSEHVARVVDVGTFQETGVPYMVMEFLDGHDLDRHLEEQGRIASPWASMLMLQAAEALGEAHAIGIVHRDVKPSNLFVTWRPDGSSIIKVLDFGISKGPIGTDMRLTQTQSLLGTPAYMSPEQMRSARTVDSRTDIWSLGVVFYELLEGRRPFEAESFSEMCVKVAVDPPQPMVQTPPALQRVVLRCLAKSPDQRYPNMYELGRDLVPFVQDHHEASLLVERMHRMVARRSQASIDRSGAIRIATPLPVHDAASGAIPTPSPFGDSSVTPTPFGADTSVTPSPFGADSAAHHLLPARRELSTPVAGIPEQTGDVRPPRRRWPLALAMLGIAGAAVAATVLLTREPARDSGSAPIVDPRPTTGPEEPTHEPDEPDEPEVGAVTPDRSAGEQPDEPKTEPPDEPKLEPPAEPTNEIDTQIEIVKDPEPPAKQQRKRKPVKRTIKRHPSRPKHDKPEVKEPPKSEAGPKCKPWERLPSGACAT